jgi:Methyltransferase domain
MTFLESRYTSPRVDCPHPEHWHSTDADSTEFEVSELVAGFVRALQPEVVVETGTAWGQTAQIIGRALERNGHGHLYTLEPDQARVEFSRDRCNGLPVTIVQQDSLTWEPPGPVGFAWFDSLIDLRAPEFRRYHQWFTPGAVVGFHDTGPQHRLRPHIDKLAADGLISVIYLPTPRGVAFAEVL